MKSKKVLIVDDNDLNRKLFENLIGQIFSFESAKNGLEAVALAEAQNFDLILMDIQMPKMDGITAMKIIRQRNTKCPIIAVTAYAEESDRTSFLQQGFDDFITKPIRPKEFLHLVRSHLSGGKDPNRTTTVIEVAEDILDKKIVDQLLKYNSNSVIGKVFDDFLEECAEVVVLIDSSSEHTSELIEKNPHAKR
ncbi:response regulator [Algoriphagus boritolerans]|uniref:response regulator n=1 Tax=Algoriphagus boritolerans TaxID=308111 RepID=UPI000A86443E